MNFPGDSINLYTITQSQVVTNISQMKADNDRSFKRQNFAVGLYGNWARHYTYTRAAVVFFLEVSLYKFQITIIIVTLTIRITLRLTQIILRCTRLSLRRKSQLAIRSGDSL